MEWPRGGTRDGCRGDSMTPEEVERRQREIRQLAATHDGECALCDGTTNMAVTQVGPYEAVPVCEACRNATPDQLRVRMDAKEQRLTERMRLFDDFTPALKAQQREGNQLYDDTIQGLDARQREVLRQDGHRSAGSLLPSKPRRYWLYSGYMIVFVLLACLAGWALAAFMAWLFPSILGPVPY